MRKCLVIENSAQIPELLQQQLICTITSSCWPGFLTGLVCGHCALDIPDLLLAVQLEGIKDAKSLETNSSTPVGDLFFVTVR